MSDTKVTYIPNELASAVKGGFVTSSKEIKDRILNLNQEEINQSFTQSKDEIL
jgi:nicotinamide mononucleotide (NMN) deamidase PncC